jgi:hypothetical protein
MKRLLVFVFAIVPMGLIISPILATILALIVFCRSFADYWEGVVNGFFHTENPKTPQTIWEKHQAKLDALNKQDLGSTNDD